MTLESLALPCLKLINEHMYPQILPTLSPHLTHRLQIGNVGDLLAPALFDQPREDIGCAGPARDVSQRWRTDLICGEGELVTAARAAWAPPPQFVWPTTTTISRVRLDRRMKKRAGETYCVVLCPKYVCEYRKRVIVVGVDLAVRTLGRIEKHAGEGV